MTSGRKVSVILRGQAKEEFEKLNGIVGAQKAAGETNSEEIQLLRSIMQKSELVKQNPAFGDSVPKRQIPKTMDVNNLFRVRLTGYWRMLYTLNTNQVEIVAFILYIVDHERYDRIFGYSKR